MRIKITRGLDLGMDGEPNQTIDRAREPRSVAVLGSDAPGLDLLVSVEQGDHVRQGGALAADRRDARIRCTAPASGRVVAVHRGARRRLQSIVIDVDGAESTPFEGHAGSDLAGLDAQDVRARLLESGLWMALRTRPFDRVPAADARPRALFVTAIDTNPLAADPAVVIAADREAFADGLSVVEALCDRIFVCKSPGWSLVPRPKRARIDVVDFAGRHPAGLTGTHVARLMPASERQPVWHVGYQDVIDIGRLFVRGRPAFERVVAVGGPGALHPRLLRTRLGAALDDLLDGELREGARPVAGSLLCARRLTPATAYLGRFETQISILAAGSGESITRQTGMLPVEAFERIWPLRTPILPLLRALLVADAETARALGCLDLGVEDLALCSYVCPAKQDYGAALTRTLRELDPEPAS